jgi:hypothetical protein
MQLATRGSAVIACAFQASPVTGSPQRRWVTLVLGQRGSQLRRARMGNEVMTVVDSRRLVPIREGNP